LPAGADWAEAAGAAVAANGRVNRSASAARRHRDGKCMRILDEMWRQVRRRDSKKDNSV
jgi:hypothetical protein